MANLLEIGLCGIPYRVTKAEGLVIFEEIAGCEGLHQRFACEKPDQFCLWMLAFADGTFNRLPLVHLAAALQWLAENEDEIRK